MNVLPPLPPGTTHYAAHYIVYVSHDESDFRVFKTRVLNQFYRFHQSSIPLECQHIETIPDALQWVKTHKGVTLLVALNTSNVTLGTFANGDLHRIDAAFQAVLGEAQLVYVPNPETFNLVKSKLRRPSDHIVPLEQCDELTSLLKEAIAKRSGGVTVLKQDMAVMQAHAEAVQESFRDLEAEVDELKARVEDLDSLLTRSSSVSGSDSILGQLRTINQAIAGIMKQLDTGVERDNRLNADITALRRDVTSMKDAIADRREVRNKILDSLLGGMLGRFIMGAVVVAIALIITGADFAVLIEFLKMLIN